MANVMTGKFWLFDTAGIITKEPVKVKSVFVTWKVSSAGAIDLTEYNPAQGEGVNWLSAATLGATSAAVDQLTQQFIINSWVDGIKLKTITNVAKLVIQVE